MQLFKGNKKLSKGFIGIVLIGSLCSCATFASIVNKNTNDSPIFDVHDNSQLTGKVKLIYEAEFGGKAKTKEADVVKYESRTIAGFILSKDTGGFMQSDSALVLQGKNLEEFHSYLTQFVADASQDLSKFNKVRSVKHYGRVDGIYRFGGISFDNEAHPQIDIGYVKSTDNRLFMSVKVYRAVNLMGQGTDTTTDDYTVPFSFLIGSNNAKALLHYMFDEVPKAAPEDVDSVPSTTAAPQATPLPDDSF